MLSAFTLERILIGALVLLILGLAGLGWCVAVWASSGFGPLQYAALLRILMLALTSIAAAIQLAFTAFLAGIMDVPAQR
jgi:hypothetical protein